MMKLGIGQKQRECLRWCLLACGFVLALGSFSNAPAVTVYSYIDDQGNPVYTDAPQTIPEKYRAKVKMHEQPDPVPKTPTMMQSMQEAVKERAKSIGFTVPVLQLDLAGLSPAQSRILTYAGCAVVVLVFMMFLSKSHLVRVLGFCLLIVVGIGTPVLMYVSDNGPMDIMKKKATAAGQAQQDRLQQVAR